MPKHHHQSRMEQRNNKEHGGAPFHFDKDLDNAPAPVELEEIAMNVVIDDSPIQQRAYQIYREKGGHALDNWLEAEQILGYRNHIADL